MTRLERLERAYTRSQRSLSATITKAEQDLPLLAEEQAQIQDAIVRSRGTRGDPFAMTVNGTRWSTRADAAIALRNTLAAIPAATGRDTNGDTRPVPVATIGGFDITATARRYLEPHLSLELDGVPRSGVRVEFDELRQDRPLGIVTKLENKITGLDHTLATITESHASIAAESERARAQYGQPFPHRDALSGARNRSTQLAAELAEQDHHRTPIPPLLGPDGGSTAAAISPATLLVADGSLRQRKAPSDLTPPHPAAPAITPLVPTPLVPTLRPRTGPRL